MKNICKETRSWPAKCVMMNCFQTRFLPRYKDIDQCRCFLHSVLHSANLILLWLRSWLFQVNMNYDRKTNVILFLNRDKCVSTIRSEYDFINVYYYHQNFQNINRKLAWLDTVVVNRAVDTSDSLSHKAFIIATYRGMFRLYMILLDVSG